MTSIKKTNAMFRKALTSGGEVSTREARQIAKALRKGGVSAGESKVVASQLKRNSDEFTSGAHKALKALIAKRGSSAQGATSSFAPAPGQQGTQGSNGGGGGGGGTVQEKAVAMAKGLKEPELPGANATPQEMLAYEKASKEFDRMFQMLSNAIKGREETLAAINRNV